MFFYEIVLERAITNWTRVHFSYSNAIASYSFKYSFLRIKCVLKPFYYYFIDTNTERESGRKAQLSNIEATKVTFSIEK